MTVKLGAKAVIFDFDGTIALSEPVHMQAWRDIADVVRKPLPEGFLEKGIGHTDQELVKDLTSYWQQKPSYDELLAMKRFYYQKRCLTESILVPGADAFIKALAVSLPLGIATSASVGDITPTLKKYNLESFFKSILTVESIRRAKPDPEIYLLSSAKLGIDPVDCLVFEDTPTGANAARAAGMRVVGLTTSYDASKLQPIVHSISDYQPIANLVAMIVKKD
jgi:HAD superfamily hydrolase (TIGR01509 family)